MRTKTKVVVLEWRCGGRRPVPSGFAALLGRVTAIRARRARLAPARWSAHMLRDIGLEDLAEETPMVIAGHLRWPAH